MLGKIHSQSKRSTDYVWEQLPRPSIFGLLNLIAKIRTCINDVCQITIELFLTSHTLQQCTGHKAVNDNLVCANYCSKHNS